MLLRGQNTVGYTPYPTAVTRAFGREAAATGVDIFRIFASLNDVGQMRPAIDAVREVGVPLAEVALCYTADLSDPREGLYTLDYYLRLAEQAGHVLDRQDVGAGRHDLLGKAQVVVQGVEAFARVGQVGGVAQCDLGQRHPDLAHGVDRRAHLLDVVQGVEDPEDVDTGGRRFPHEGPRDRRGVRGVPDGVLSAQQHLQRDVRQGRTHGREPLPRVLAEEPERDVVGRPAPGLHAQQPTGHPGDVRGDREEVVGAHPGGEQGLMGVAEGRVGDRDGGLLAQGAGEPLRTQLEQPLPTARGGRLREIDHRQLRARTWQPVRWTAVSYTHLRAHETR